MTQKKRNMMKNHSVNVDPFLVAYARKVAVQELNNYHRERRKNAQEKILQQPFA